MSLIKLRHNDQQAQNRLEQRLTEEFAHPSPEYAQPFINIEQPGNRFHLLVIWDDWEPLSQQDRSVLIMNSYRQAEGEDAASRVSVAMGLTQREADRLGFAFDPISAAPIAA